MRNEKTDAAMRAGRSFFVVLFIVVVALGIWWINRPARPYSWTINVLEMPCTIKVQDRHVGTVMKTALDTMLPDLLGNLDVKFSRAQSYGLIHDFNASTSTTPVKISADVWRVIDFKYKIQKASSALSLTQGPIEDYWQRVAEGRAQPPDADDIARMLANTASYKLSVPADSYLRKVSSDIQVNIDDCAPGYIADAIATLLRGEKIEHFFISVGDVIIASEMPGPSVMPIFPASEGKIPGLPRADITVGCMATVGGPDSKKVHIDPRTGYPASNGVFSVSVTSDSALNAAGLAAALYILGPKNGLSWLATNPIAIGEALFVMKRPDGTSELVKSPAFPLAEP